MWEVGLTESLCGSAINQKENKKLADFKDSFLQVEMDNEPLLAEELEHISTRASEKALDEDDPAEEEQSDKKSSSADMDIPKLWDKTKAIFKKGRKGRKKREGAKPERKPRQKLKVDQAHANFL